MTLAMDVALLSLQGGKQQGEAIEQIV